MDDELRSRIERMRIALAGIPMRALIGSIPLPRRDLPESVVAFDQLAELFCVADGVRAHEFMLWGVDDLQEPGPHLWLEGGVNRWLTIGRNHCFYLVLDRRTQEVAELDADAASEIIRNLGPYREVVRGLFSDDYLRLSYGLGREWDDLRRQTCG